MNNIEEYALNSPTSNTISKLMPLQNRVSPFGDIVSVSARGTCMGNRPIRELSVLLSLNYYTSNIVNMIKYDVESLLI